MSGARHAGTSGTAPEASRPAGVLSAQPTELKDALIDAVDVRRKLTQEGSTAGAKAVAATVIDLLTRPELLEAAREYFAEQTGRSSGCR